MKYLIDISDARNMILKQLLIKDGEQVLDFNEDNLKNLNSGDSLIFSPAKKFDKEFLESLPNNIKLICGNLTDESKQIISEKQIFHQNLMEDEIFSVKNANLTAEGIIAKILELSPKSIYENNVLILGGGRIAIALSVLLAKLGVKFSIVSFNNIKFPRYYLYTNICFYKKQYLNEIQNYDVIVNTIPAKIFEDEEIKKIKEDTLFLETASLNCLDENKANHFVYLKCPALPSKYCLVSAGRLMYEAIKGENIYD